MTDAPAPLALAFMLVALGLWAFYPPERGSQLIVTRDVLLDVLLRWLALLGLVLATVLAVQALP